MTFNFVTFGNMNGFGMMLPPLPPLPQAPCCGWGSVSRSMSLFTTMALFNAVTDNTFSFLNNTSVPKARVWENDKPTFSYNNIFNPLTAMQNFFAPVTPILPTFNFKFTQPIKNLFSFNTNKTPARRYSSSTSWAARSVAPTQTTSLSEVAKIYNAKKGVKLANEAIDGLKYAQKGYCARAVKTAIQDAGLGSYESGHAYQCPDILKRNPNFKEVKVKGSDLDKLPAGCILAYNRGDAGYNPYYGHIEIKGQRNQAIHYTVNNNIKESDNVRVFVPV